MRRTQSFLALILVLVLPAKAGALDLGLTPSHVFSLWSNINQAVLTIAQLNTTDAALTAEVGAMKAAGFSGKNPADVLALALEVQGHIDALRIASDLSPGRRIIVTDETTTPSDVFLESSLILSSTVEWIIKNTGPDHLISGHFARHAFSAKTPSDVFGLVDLAHRRIHLILNIAGDGSHSAKAHAQ